MREFSLRRAVSGDEPALKALWSAAFGDPEDYIDRFFETLYRPENTVTGEADGRIVSAMYVLPGQTLYPFRKNTLSASYTYALATLPEYRSRGIGRAVFRAACELALETADAACVLPAEPALYPFYENAAGAAPVSYLREAWLTKADLAGIAPRMAARIPGYQYAGIRDQLLRGEPHASLPPEFFDLMEDSGVEFFVLEGGLAAAERDGGRCRILELLPGEDVSGAIAGVARWCPAEEYAVRTPLFFDGPGETRPYMLAVLKQTPPYPMPADLWWGFGLE